MEQTTNRSQMDLIRRSELLSTFKRWDSIPSYNEGERNIIKAAIYETEIVPAVDAVPMGFHDRCMQIEIQNRMEVERNRPEVAHAYWKRVHDDVCYWSECSNCGGDMPLNRYRQEWESPVCPTCGARMDGRREDGVYDSLKRGLEEAIAYECGEVDCRVERREDGDA